MAKKNRDIISGEHQATILAAVKKAESLTSGEIVPMVVARSDDYREGAMNAAIFMATILALAVALATGNFSVWFFLPLLFFFYFPAKALIHRLPFFKLAFTPVEQITNLVHLRAMRAFFESGLHRTRAENGILIFISMLERRVWILGDRGINAVIPPERWVSLASALAAGIREKRMEEALVITIGEIGDILRQHFPHTPDDTNELPDLIKE